MQGHELERQPGDAVKQDRPDQEAPDPAQHQEEEERVAHEVGKRLK
jgi:hypothetical protein